MGLNMRCLHFSLKIDTFFMVMISKSTYSYYDRLAQEITEFIQSPWNYIHLGTRESYKTVP